MTRVEYNNTVRDLLGDTTEPAASFAVEEEALGFNNNAANLVTSAALAERYMLAAEGIAERALLTPEKLLPCDPLVTGNESCGQQFIANFGKRAFRRPLTADETAMLGAQFSAGLAADGFKEGIARVIQTGLQAPQFLYRVELGTPAAAGESVVRLSGWETASRLSYLLWGSMPDEELFQAAETGALASAEQVAAQAGRMLADPKARAAVENFHQQWLDYDRIKSVGKDSTAFPEWSAEIGGLMREETRAYLDHVVFDGAGDLRTLLTSSTGFMNAKLAQFYGVTGPAGGAFEKVTLDPAQRSGVLTLGTLLTINAHSNQTSPVHRGLLVRQTILCGTIPPPPPDVIIKAPEPDPNSTARQRFAEHSENPACGGCHSLMDSIGFGFENYDAMGRFRSHENGQLVDASGELTNTDVDGGFVGVAELASKLAGSRDAQACYAKQWFRFAYGRGEGAADACTLASLEQRFTEAGGNIKELLVALTQTDAFLFKTIGGAP
jgi:hypothetical protein